MTRKYILMVFFFSLAYMTHGQIIGNSEAFGEEMFYTASGQYVNGELEDALSTVNKGLSKDPQNQKLQELKKLLEKEKQEQEQQQQEDQKKNEEQQDQEQKDQEQQQKDQEQQDQQSEQEKKEEEQQQENEQKEEDQEKSEEEKEQEEKQKEEEQKQKEMEQFEKKLEEMNISEEKAKMILEAMKNSEKQYLQQIKRKGKRKESGKPDW